VDIQAVISEFRETSVYYTWEHEEAFLDSFGFDILNVFGMYYTSTE
jgi:hypothetical protein